jgi:hypothetical protein
MVYGPLANRAASIEDMSESSGRIYKGFLAGKRSGDELNQRRHATVRYVDVPGCYRACSRHERAGSREYALQYVHREYQKSRDCRHAQGNSTCPPGPTAERITG